MNLAIRELNLAMKQQEINDKCIDMILGIGSMGSSLELDLTMAEHFGLDDHNFSEQDLKNLEIIYDNLWNVCDDIPDFENIVRWDEPIRKPECRVERNFTA